MKRIEEKIQDLRQKLRRWEYSYYIKSRSLVSDEKYDQTLLELKQLELSYPNLVSSTSPTQCIDKGMLQTGFNQIQHRVSMLSLNNIVSESQLLLFDKRIKNKLHNNSDITYCCELKLDGVAISLLYKQGKLIQSATRGNGRLGEDVLKNVYPISSIPIYLCRNDNGSSNFPYLLEIRGEIFISKSCFLKLNQEMLQQGMKPFSNSRNATSGFLRRLKSSIHVLRLLSFCCYGVSYYVGENKLSNSHLERLLLCESWGIPISHHSNVVKGINSVLYYYNYVKKIRSDLEYDIDGVVVKVDSCVDQDILGSAYKSPNWAIAYKFPAESRYTKLNSIVFKVGRTGLITPIAHIQPVIINNVLIKKVNIHNTNEIKRLDLMIGDVVQVQRSGDVIPRILKVVLSDRSKSVKSIQIPKICPACGIDLKPIQDNQSFILRCTARLTCIAQRKALLKHFSSKKAMNIRGMGEKIIDQLVDENLILSPIDFFYLNKNKLLRLRGYGLKSVERLLRSIDASKKTTFSAFIYALGIPGVGEVVANNLAKSYGTIEALVSTDLQSLTKLKCVGKIMSFDIYSFFHNASNLSFIYSLIGPDIGIKW